jgi:hypothetical protein
MQFPKRRFCFCNAKTMDKGAASELCTKHRNSLQNMQRAVVGSQRFARSFRH